MCSSTFTIFLKIQVLNRPQLIIPFSKDPKEENAVGIFDVEFPETRKN